MTDRNSATADLVKDAMNPPQNGNLDNYEILEVNLNEEFKIKIEEGDKLQSSFFKTVYERARKATNDILRQSEINLNQLEEARQKGKNLAFLDKDLESNNIITFCGERGTGKSSAMISFAQALLEKNRWITNEGILAKYSFHAIEVIDPSLFEKEENIFEVILAQLFSSFEKELNDSEKNRDLKDKRSVLKLFEKVYGNLRTIKKNGVKYDGEALETLSQLACGANLRNNFKELVEKYLEFVTGKKENTALILAIDDFDLNVEAVAEMAEQIRKYLLLPRVVILMAANIEQLSDAKEQAIRNSFSTMLKHDAFSSDPTEMTINYLRKLLPNPRCIQLPVLNEVSNQKISIQLKNTEKIQFYESIENAILKELKAKTDLVFLKNLESTHYLVPNNLRELVHFLNFIHGLDGSKLENIKAFRDYILYGEYTRGLPSKLRETFQKIYQADASEKNKILIQHLTNYLLDKRNKELKRNDAELERVFPGNRIPDLTRILNRNNYSSNISLGDVIYFIELLEKYYYHDSKVVKTINIVKVIYTVILKEYHYNKNWEDLEKIIAGRVYNPYSTKLLRKNRDNFVFRIEVSKKAAGVDTLIVNNTLLKEELLKVDSGSKINETSQAIELLHYFIIFNGKLDTEDYRYKSPWYYKSRAWYNQGGRSVNHLTFNILGFVAKCLNPKFVFTNVYSTELKDGKIPEEYNNSIGANITNEDKNKLIAPFTSIDLIMHLLDHFERYDIKEKAETYDKSFRLFFKELFSFFDSIEIDYKNSVHSTSLMKELFNFEKKELEFANPSFQGILKEFDSDIVIDDKYVLITKFINDIDTLLGADLKSMITKFRNNYVKSFNEDAFIQSIQNLRGELDVKGVDENGIKSRIVLTVDELLEKEDANE